MSSILSTLDITKRNTNCLIDSSYKTVRLTRWSRAKSIKQRLYLYYILKIIVFSISNEIYFERLLRKLYDSIYQRKRILWRHCNVLSLLS